MLKLVFLLPFLTLIEASINPGTEGDIFLPVHPDPNQSCVNIKSAFEIDSNLYPPNYSQMVTINVPEECPGDATFEFLSFALQGNYVYTGCFIDYLQL